MLTRFLFLVAGYLAIWCNAASAQQYGFDAECRPLPPPGWMMQPQPPSQSCLDQRAQAQRAAREQRPAPSYALPQTSTQVRRYDPAPAPETPVSTSQTSSYRPGAMPQTSEQIASFVERNVKGAFRYSKPDYTPVPGSFYGGRYIVRRNKINGIVGAKYKRYDGQEEEMFVDIRDGYATCLQPSDHLSCDSPPVIPIPPAETNQLGERRLAGSTCLWTTDSSYSVTTYTAWSNGNITSNSESHIRDKITNRCSYQVQVQKDCHRFFTIQSSHYTLDPGESVDQGSIMSIGCDLYQKN